MNKYKYLRFVAPAVIIILALGIPTLVTYIFNLTPDIAAVTGLAFGYPGGMFAFWSAVWCHDRYKGFNW